MVLAIYFTFQPVHKSVFRYTRSELLGLRNRECVCVNRQVARKFKYFRIYLRHIPVITSKVRSRTSLPSSSPSEERGRSNLVRIRSVGEATERKRKRNHRVLPSILLTIIGRLIGASLSQTSHIFRFY